MPSPIELTLSNLLPTISFLPPELIALSNSFLAQSRAKAATLKSEEEIGRTYACCHIACERLKNKLALEIGKPAPPVKPRVYNKLHAYLDSVLKTTATPRTPTTKRQEDKLKSSGTPSTSTKKRGRDDVTPSKPAATTTSVKRLRDGTQKPSHAGLGEEQVPKFVMPLIRHICKALDAPQAAPHVFVGVSTILPELQNRGPDLDATTPPAKKRGTTRDKNSAPQFESDDFVIQQLPALAAMLSEHAVARMRGLDRDDDGHAKAMRHIHTIAAKAATDCSTESDLEGPKQMSHKDIVEHMETLQTKFRESWQAMDWFQSVPDGLEGPAEGDDNDDDEDKPLTPVKRPAKTPLRRKEKHGKRPMDDEGEDLGAAGLLPGLGTMFQPAVDWFSDERRDQFAVWKRRALQQIPAM